MSIIVCACFAILFGNISYIFHVNGYEGMTVLNGVVAITLGTAAIFEFGRWLQGKELI